ncbi:MAG: integrase core domain-containing protein, partial [Thermodesulfobacteriota bacterium]
EQSFTSYNNPKGNADTERMIRTMKEELFWLREWENERELSLELDKWVQNYNRNYLHSAHGYRTPIQVEEDYHKTQIPHKITGGLMSSVDLRISFDCIVNLLYS